MPIGEPFIQLIEVESTNNYAMARVQAHLADHGAAWFAHTQIAGKGQRGKVWLSAPGENIILSCVITPKPLVYSNVFILSAAVALACHDFFSFYALDETKIKWPNDIYWKDRKAGGILIENEVQGCNWKYAIAGIGININQVTFPLHLANPVSLRQITGKRFEAPVLAKELCACLENRWRQVQQNKWNDLLNEYRLRLYKLNEQVTFKKGNAEFTAVVCGVSNEGELIVNTDEQTLIPFGTVEWLIN